MALIASETELVKEILGFLRQNVNSKFRNTGKLIPFVFGGENVVKNAKRSTSIFEKPKTARKFGE